MTATRLPAWQPANNGSGKRIWFLIRNEPECIRRSIPIRDRYHWNSRGDLIRYASCKTAQHAADRLNRTEDNRAFVRALLAELQPAASAALERTIVGSLS